MRAYDTFGYATTERQKVVLRNTYAGGKNGNKAP
jgi:hypothetical protein